MHPQWRRLQARPLVQTASLTVGQAVAAVNETVPGGFVGWAVPTIRDTRSGCGVSTPGKDDTAHDFFVKEYSC